MRVSASLCAVFLLLWPCCCPANSVSGSFGAIVYQQHGFLDFSVLDSGELLKVSVRQVSAPGISLGYSLCLATASCLNTVSEKGLVVLTNEQLPCSSGPCRYTLNVTLPAVEQHLLFAAPPGIPPVAAIFGLVESASSVARGELRVSAKSPPTPAAVPPGEPILFHFAFASTNEFNAYSPTMQALHYPSYNTSSLAFCGGTVLKQAATFSFQHCLSDDPLSPDGQWVCSPAGETAPDVGFFEGEFPCKVHDTNLYAMQANVTGVEQVSSWMIFGDNPYIKHVCS